MFIKRKIQFNFFIKINFIEKRFYKFNFQEKQNYYLGTNKALTIWVTSIDILLNLVRTSN